MPLHLIKYFSEAYYYRGICKGLMGDKKAAIYNALPFFLTQGVELDQFCIIVKGIQSRFPHVNSDTLQN